MPKSIIHLKAYSQIEILLDAKPYLSQGYKLVSAPKFSFGMWRADVVRDIKDLYVKSGKKIQRNNSFTASDMRGD